jgi:hypothetical protein
MSSLKSARHSDLPLRARCGTALHGSVDGNGPGLWDRAILIDFETFKAYIL